MQLTAGYAAPDIGKGRKASLYIKRPLKRRRTEFHTKKKYKRRAANNKVANSILYAQETWFSLIRDILFTNISEMTAEVSTKSTYPGTRNYKLLTYAYLPP